MCVSARENVCVLERENVFVLECVSVYMQIWLWMYLKVCVMNKCDSQLTQDICAFFLDKENL